MRGDAGEDAGGHAVVVAAGAADEGRVAEAAADEGHAVGGAQARFRASVASAETRSGRRRPWGGVQWDVVALVPHAPEESHEAAGLRGEASVAGPSRSRGVPSAHAAGGFDHVRPAAL